MVAAIAMKQLEPSVVEYQLKYIDLTYQNHKIITLVQQSGTTTKIIRVGKEEGFDGVCHFCRKYINAYIRPCETDDLDYSHQCFRGERNSCPAVGEREILFDKVFALEEATCRDWPEIFRVTFCGKIVDFKGMCRETDITNQDLTKEWEDVISRIFDEAQPIYEIGK